LSLVGENEPMEPAQVYLTFTRPTATAIAGRKVDDMRKVVLVGAGSLGSQMSLNLTREGRFVWTVIDNDYLLPHNLARHALLGAAVGAPKAVALASELGRLLDEKFDGIVANILSPGDLQAQINAALTGADAIIDASASVAVSRHLSDLPNLPARRVSTFFNPTGTAVVVLAEPTDRSVTLRDLEAQYHSLIQSEPRLAEHLAVVEQGVRYSGSCRALTNRIPASRAAILGALAAQGVTQALEADKGSIAVWTLGSDGSAAVLRQQPHAAHRVDTGEWLVTYDDGVAENLVRLRLAHLPAETGGVLLGIADMSVRSIHIVHALPETGDSHGSVTGFERGVVGLRESINQSIEASLYQLRYLGEWHSHPRRASAQPSHIDLAQLAWLTNELDAEGLPALMCIVADNGELNLVLGQVREDEERDGDGSSKHLRS
jgi:integrative and conjugative element protein (TIGR02256 family)